MSKKRMFSPQITDSDAFIDMPLSTQCLYFHLCMHSDDDGFCNQTKKIARMIGASEDDLKLLLIKKFVIAFDTGVLVIKHWRMHNYIRGDRYTETVYKEEKAQLDVDESNIYHLMPPCHTIGTPDDIPVVIPAVDTDKIREDKIRLDKISVEESSDDLTSKSSDTRTSTPRMRRPSLDEIKDYFFEIGGTETEAESFFDYYSANGWKVGKNPMKNWKSACNNWHRNEHKFTTTKQPPKKSSAWEDTYNDLFGGDV